jgi:hypothetical protein
MTGTNDATEFILWGAESTLKNKAPLFMPIISECDIIVLVWVLGPYFPLFINHTV